MAIYYQNHNNFGNEIAKNCLFAKKLMAKT